MAVSGSAAAGEAVVGDAVAGVVAGPAAGSVAACSGIAAAFDASMVDVVVAIAAAAIASGCRALSDDTGVLTATGTTGAAITTATGTIAAAGCATGSAEDSRSVVPTTSEAASFKAVFPVAGFAASGFNGLLTAAPEPAAASAGCGADVALLRSDAGVVASWQSDAADGSCGRCCGDGRSDAVTVARSSLRGLDTAPSTNAEKPSGAGA